MPLQWHKQFWQSLEEGAGKRCSECSSALVAMAVGRIFTVMLEKKEKKMAEMSKAAETDYSAVSI